MPALDETILFSATALLLAAMTLSSLTGLAYPLTSPVVIAPQAQLARFAVCSSATAAPAAPGAAERHG